MSVRSGRIDSMFDPETQGRTAADLCTRIAASYAVLRETECEELLLAAAWAAGLRGTPLEVTVLFAALPIGSNALLFAQRYRTLEAETTAAIVASTIAFVVTGPAWILATHLLA